MQKDYYKIINDLSDKKFAIYFLNKNKNKLQIKNKIQDAHIKIYHKRCKETGKRLIATYNFLDGGKEKNITIKLRIYKDKNFAKRAWIVTKNIWTQLAENNKFIPEPLYYFEDLDLFAYKTALGSPLNEFFGEIEFDEMLEKINTSAKHLAKFHTINTTPFDSNDFCNEHGLLGQLDNFYKFLKLSKFERAYGIINAVEETIELIEKYSIRDSLVHGDFQVENFIFDKKNLKLIDFDFTEINDPLIDVGNFLVQIFYGGAIGRNVEKYRASFLDVYLDSNKKLNKNNFVKRVNLYIAVAKLKNINNGLMHTGTVKKEKLDTINYDLKRARRRLDNLDGDPLELFKKRI